MVKIKAIITDGENTKEFELKEKRFKTGSRGFHGFGKAYFNDKKYQVNILVVKIGSKEVE